MIWRLWKFNRVVEPLGDKWACYADRNYRHVARTYRKFGLRLALGFLVNVVLLKRGGSDYDIEQVAADNS